MRVEEVKKHYDIKSCPNPSHPFQIGRMIGEWQMAETEWVKVDSKGDLMTFYIHLGKVTSVDNLILYRLIFWKLSVTLGFLSK